MSPAEAQQYAFEHGADKIRALKIEYAFQGTLNVLTIPTTGDLPESVVLGRAAQVITNIIGIHKRARIPLQSDTGVAGARITSQEILRGRRDIITSVEIEKSTSAGSPALGTREDERTFTRVKRLAACGSAWLPGYHYTDVTGAGVQGRYVYQINRWGSWRMGDLKCNADTYEAEFKTYNYDGGHYFSTNADDVLATNCNFPRCYLDTGAFDSDNEPQYTMGSADIDAATAGTNYTTYIQVRVGNVSVDSAKTQGQIGQRTPDWCSSTWCIFAVDTREQTAGWWTIPGSITVDR